MHCNSRYHGMSMMIDDFDLLIMMTIDVVSDNSYDDRR